MYNHFHIKNENIGEIKIYVYVRDNLFWDCEFYLIYIFYIH